MKVDLREKKLERQGRAWPTDLETDVANETAQFCRINNGYAKLTGEAWKNIQIRMILRCFQVLTWASKVHGVKPLKGKVVPEDKLLRNPF